MKNKAAQELGTKGGKSTSDAKKGAARKNGLKGGRPKQLKLMDISLPARVYCEASDGSKYVFVDHLDGMYSYGTTENGAVVHLSIGTPLKKEADGYRIAE